MSGKSKLSLIFVIAVLAYISAAHISQAKTNNGKLSKIIIQSLENYHYSGKLLNANFSEKGLDEFIKILDFDRSFFLDSDIKNLKQKSSLLKDELEAGSMELMKLAFQLKNQRIDQVMTFYPTLLKGKLDFTKDESFETESDKRGYFKDLDQLKEYWRKRLKYRTITRYIALRKSNDKKKKGKRPDMELREKAKDEVLKSTKRILEQIKKAGSENSFSRYLNSILSVFDPHTSYFPPKDKQDFDIEMSGSLEGIGALLSQEGDYVKVVEIIPGGPAWKQKQLGPEDKILKVAQGDAEAVDIVGMGTRDAVKIIRGKKGSLVRLTVTKPDGRIMEIPIVRDIVVIEETFAKSIIINDKQKGLKIGYISLKSFYNDFSGKTGRNSYDDVKQELEKLKRKKVSGIVFDLRSNRGGALTDAVKISGLFIKEGPIVQIQGRITGKEILNDPDPSLQYDGPLVILINTLSASASEIMAAALQDYKRAVIVGDAHSFGKGTVQILLDLNRMISGHYEGLDDPGALKMTIKKFYRINGGSNQYKGVIPDIILPGVYDSFEIGEQYLDYSLKWDTISKVPYEPYDSSDIPMTSLKIKSKNRVKNSRYFSELLSYNRELERRKQETVQSLDIRQIEQDQANIRERLSKIKKARSIQKQFAFVFTDGNNGNGNKELIEIEKGRRQNWIRLLEKDMELFECVHIIQDMLKKS